VAVAEGRVRSFTQRQVGVAKALVASEGERLSTRTALLAVANRLRSTRQANKELKASVSEVLALCQQMQSGVWSSLAARVEGLHARMLRDDSSDDDAAASGTASVHPTA
jgi:anti-sigma factor ChrR (cupin superfamily)